MVGATPRFAGPNMGVRPDAPTIETIVWVTFYESITLHSQTSNFSTIFRISSRSIGFEMNPSGPGTAGGRR